MKDTLGTYESIFGLLPDVDNPTPLVRFYHVPGYDHTAVFAKLEKLPHDRTAYVLSVCQVGNMSLFRRSVPQQPGL